VKNIESAAFNFCLLMSHLSPIYSVISVTYILLYFWPISWAVCVAERRHWPGNVRRHPGSSRARCRSPRRQQSVSCTDRYECIAC